MNASLRVTLDLQRQSAVLAIVVEMRLWIRLIMSLVLAEFCLYLLQVEVFMANIICSY